MLAFGGTATLAGLLGVWQCRVRPRPRLVRAWVVDHRDLGGRYLVENVSVGAARQLRMTAVGLIAGLVAVGQIRAAEILMGPFLMLLSGVSQVAVPETRHVLLRAPRRLKRFCLLLGSAQAALAAAWGITLLIVLPLGLGEILLGDLWEAAYPLLVPIVLALLLGCYRVSISAGLRALGASKRSLAAELGEASANLGFGVLGAFIGGAQGSCWGFALGASVGALLWWRQLGLGLAEHRPDHVRALVA
jgi:O-antigen/teichoic acid export membrane protein